VYAMVIAGGLFGFMLFHEEKKRTGTKSQGQEKSGDTESGDTV